MIKFVKFGVIHLASHIRFWYFTSVLYPQSFILTIIMKKEYKTKWGKKLRKARIDMELTLAEATKLLFDDHGIKLDPAQLARVERGESDCAVNKFKALCQIYDVSPSQVLDLEEKKK